MDWRNHLPQDEGLPRTSDAQDIGEDAYDCLRAHRPKSWSITPTEGGNDFGFDYLVQLRNGQQVVHPFRLQLKGTRSPKRSANGTFLSIALATSTLRYYSNTDEPVLLVLCDLSEDPENPTNGIAYYVWMQEELERIDLRSIPLSQEEAVLRVPTTNVLTKQTDVLDLIRVRFRLSRIGHTLNRRVEELDPSMASEDRVGMIEAITGGVGARSIAFAQALAEPVKDVWINPPRGSLPKVLTDAKAAIRLGKTRKCEALLKQVEEKLLEASALEQAEYWYLKGRLLLAHDEDLLAARAFKTASQIASHSKYWASWAETELRVRFKETRCRDYSDLIAELPDTQEPELVAIKARLLAASNRYEEAITLLDSIEGTESLATLAIIQTMTARHEEALKTCIKGLGIEDATSEAKRCLFVILRARSKYAIALLNADYGNARESDTLEDIFPPCGPIGVDAEALRLAWEDIEEAVRELEDINWVANAPYVVDMWTAAASMLGREEQIFDRLKAAARNHRDEAAIQSAFTTIAAQCGKFEDALEANNSTPDGPVKSLRQVAFYHELKRHRDCVEAMASAVDGVDHSHRLFPWSMIGAIVSADILARDDLVQEWRSVLLAGAPEYRAHVGVVDYVIASKRSPLKRADALLDLISTDTEMGHPGPTTQLLFQELDTGDLTQAEQLLAVAARLRGYMRLSPMVAVRVASALATLGRWLDLIALCKESEREFDLPPRIKAFHALALDHVGRSDEATQIIEAMLENELDDGLALCAYVNIMIRWGMIEKAKIAVELILQKAPSRERQMECIRMLFHFERQVKPLSSQATELALRMGALVNQEDEFEEGAFISMALVACWRRFKIEPPCRLNFEPGLLANR